VNLGDDDDDDTNNHIYNYCIEMKHIKQLITCTIWYKF